MVDIQILARVALQSGHRAVMRTPITEPGLVARLDGGASANLARATTRWRAWLAMSGVETFRDRKRRHEVAACTKRDQRREAFLLHFVPAIHTSLAVIAPRAALASSKFELRRRSQPLSVPCCDRPLRRSACSADRHRRKHGNVRACWHVVGIHRRRVGTLHRRRRASA